MGTRLGAEVELPAWLLGGTAISTLVIALASGLIALRSIKGLDPALLLH